MATNIDIDDVTNATEVNNGTGIFDKLIGAAFLHINDQVDANRLTQGEAGEVYSAAIQSAMAQAIQFVLQEKQTEAQVDMVIAQTSELLLNGVADRELKVAQLTLAEKDLEIKDIQKQVTYVERVIKDKEAAALGMDNAIKISQTSKASDDTYVYTPQYEES